jgi:hypothetical protein
LESFNVYHDANDLSLPHKNGLVWFRSFPPPFLQTFWTGPFFSTFFCSKGHHPLAHVRKV